MADGYKGFDVSVDLISEAQSHLAFLRDLDGEPGIIRQPHIVQNAIRRYENMWLVLAAKHDNKDLEPPADVYWIWHCHMLCPRSYGLDCGKLVKKIPIHKFHIIKTERKHARIVTKAIWEAMHPEEPFDANYDNIPVDYTYESKLSYDVSAASERQRPFFYHVSLPHYGLVPFLKTAFERYQKFVFLKKQNPDDFLVPMYDVDLMWHTHQLHPLNYRVDTESFLGFVLNHDDTTTDRSPDSKLVKGDARTRTLWQETFNEPFPIPGVMNRGMCSRGKLYRSTTEDLATFMPKKCHLRVDRVCLDGLMKDKLKVAGKVSLWKTAKSGTTTKTLQLRKQPPFDWGTNTPNGLFTLDLDTRYSVNIDVNLHRKDGIKGMLVGKPLLSCHFKPGEMVDKLNASNSTSGFTMSETTAEGLKCSVHCSVFKLENLSETFTVLEGEFEQAIMPETCEQMWGPISLPKLPHGVVNKCSVANHRLTNHKGEVTFTVRVIHAVFLKTSVVQVFYRDKLTVVSHLIGLEQLPRPEQVSLPTKCICLDPKRGERVMIIKNSNGDWGAVKGVWLGFKRGKPPKYRGDPGDKGEPGHLGVRFVDLVHDRSMTCTVMERPPYGCMRKKTFEMNAFQVDLHSGDVTINGSCTDVAENICLAFNISLLFVLCQPRPEVMKTGTIQEISMLEDRGCRLVENLDAHTIVWFMACGYCVDTPSNSWLYWNTHSNRENSIHDSDDDHIHEDRPSEQEHRPPAVDDPEYAIINGEDEGLRYLDPDDPDHPEYDLDLDDLCFGGESFCPWNPDPECKEGEDPEVIVDTSGCGGCGSCGAAGSKDVWEEAADCGTSNWGVSSACGTSSSHCGTSAACGAGPSCGADDNDVAGIFGDD